jgi:thioredoxin reductase
MSMDFDILIIGGGAAGKDAAFLAPRTGFDGRMVLSQRDSTIVARHEVPGIMRKIAPSQRDD